MVVRHLRLAVSYLAIFVVVLVAVITTFPLGPTLGALTRSGTIHSESAGIPPPEAIIASRSPIPAHTAAMASSDLSPASTNNLANTVVATVRVGTNPLPPAYDTANGDIYVPNSGSGNVSVISGSTNAVVTSVRVGNSPWGPTYDPANDEIYVPNNGGANVSVITGINNTVVATVAVGVAPWPPTFDPANGDIYVPGSFNLSVISGSNNQAIASVPGCFTTPTYDSNNDNLYVPSCTDNVTVISGVSNTVLTTILVGSGPDTPVLDPSNGNLYVPDVNSYNVTVISGSSNSVVATVYVGTLPSGAVYDNANDEIYVPSMLFDSVSAILGSTNKVVSTIPVGSIPVTPAYDSNNGDVYVPNSDSSSVSVISGLTNTVEMSIPIGAGQGPLLYDSENGNIYAVNADNVSVIAGGYSVTFTETGFLAGTWTASLANTVRSVSAGSPIEIEATNGSWYFSIGAEPGFLVSPSSGIVVVAGSPQTVAVTFTAGVPPRYLVTFSETGLMPGTNWTVTLGYSAENTTGTSITYQEPAGAYPFTVSPVLYYTESPGSGNVNVSIESVSVSITFIPANGWLNGTVDPWSASLTVGGVPISVSNGTFHVSLAPGTYAVVATAGGHATYNNNATVLPGMTTLLAITLQSITSGEISSVDLTYPLVALVAGAAIGGVVGFLVGRYRKSKTV